MDKILQIENDAFVQIEIKKSKFLCFSFGVQSKQQVEDVIAKLKAPVRWELSLFFTSYNINEQMDSSLILSAYHQLLSMQTVLRIQERSIQCQYHQMIQDDLP